MPPKKDAKVSKPSKPSASAPRQTVLTGTGFTANTAPSEQVKHFTVAQSNSKPIACQRWGDPDKKLALVFTHGAGGGLSAAATTEFCAGFAGAAPCVGFEGSMSVPARVKGFHAVAAAEEKCDGAFGGRSMGARAAVVAATENGVTKALVLVSYPLVGAQKGDVRDQILVDLPGDADVLFVSGDGDSMCGLEQLKAVMARMKARTWLVEVKGADHGMSLRQKKGNTPVRKKTGEIAALWLTKRDADKSYCVVEWDQAQSKVRDGGWVDSGNLKGSTKEGSSATKKRKRG